MPEEEKSFFNQWDDAIKSITLKGVEKHTCVYCGLKSAIHAGTEPHNNTIKRFFDCVSCKRYFIEVYEYHHTVNEQKKLMSDVLCQTQ